MYSFIQPFIHSLIVKYLSMDYVLCARQRYNISFISCLCQQTKIVDSDKFVNVWIWCFCKCITLVFFNYYFCSITVFLISPHCSHLPLPPSSHSQSPPCCLCPWVIYTCSLTKSFPFFPPISPLNPPIRSLSVCSLFPCL